MLDFICMVFAEQLSKGYKRAIQHDNVGLRRESNQRSLAFQRVPLTTRLSGCCRHVYKTFTVFIYATILQELCVVCKGIYRKFKLKNCLLTVS